MHPIGKIANSSSGRQQACGTDAFTGTVYEATDNALQRRVAVKVIRDDWTGSPEAAHRFRREARASASFAHPNVVTVYDFGVESESRGFLVMELLTGETFRDELARTTRLHPNRVLQLMRGVCAAVDAAHELRLIHRDLKPENIFVARSGSTEAVKVLDFGVAKFLSRDDAATAATLETNTGVLIGTLSYMSREQLLGEKPDTSWDIWALSVVSYEALTGALPFGPSSSKEWHSGVLSGSFISLDRYLPNAPARWQGFFARTFSINRGKRPQSVAEFFRHLEEALSQH
jgi:serine/threonine protein kinase